MSQSQNNNERLLGLDYGLSHTGVAICESGIASPIKIINSKNFNHLQSEISALIVKNKINKVVVGLPLSATGHENDQSLIVRRFVNNLKMKIYKQLILVL